MKVAEKRGDAFGAPGWEHESYRTENNEAVRIFRYWCQRY